MITQYQKAKQQTKHFNKQQRYYIFSRKQIIHGLQDIKVAHSAGIEKSHGARFELLHCTI